MKLWGIIGIVVLLGGMLWSYNETLNVQIVVVEEVVEIDELPENFDGLKIL